jgi:hypothetical protein
LFESISVTLKKLAVIFILASMVFNWIGYRLLSKTLERQADALLQAKLDENTYDESELISIKVPLASLPYTSNSMNYHGVNGEIEINGMQYKYCKTRIYNDSLEMLCFPNRGVMKIQTARNEFFKLVNDLQLTGQGKKSGPHQGSAKNFTLDSFTLLDPFTLNDFVHTTPNRSCSYSCLLASADQSTAERPPDAIC